MKVRITIDDARLFHCTGSCPVTNPFGIVIIPTPQVCQQPDDQMAHQRVPIPLQESDYNHLSIRDIQSFNQFKGMDILHKSDAVARYYDRGERLRNSLSKEGMSGFVKHYSADK